PAFQFIKDVGVDWDWTKIIDAKVAGHVVTARKEKGKEAWFVGGIAGDSTYLAQVDFSFLPKGKKYTAIIYKDADDADYLKTPEKCSISKVLVESGSSLPIEMKQGGGFAISIK
ncbi:MAG: glycoside hydrolase family 97 C-terminal domain-containing protein, partial [Leadbetterella sp.]